MPSRLDRVEQEIGACLAEIARLNRRLDDLNEDMKAANRAREPMQSETNLSIAPLGFRINLKNVAPWAIVCCLSITAIIIALLKR